MGESAACCACARKYAEQTRETNDSASARKACMSAISVVSRFVDDEAACSELSSPGIFPEAKVQEKKEDSLM